jgi:NAD(P)-dependent dehydrogenase (short-subunit alcohol dehydrogenase family)
MAIALRDGNVVITGGGGLLGRALGHAFAARGANIVLVDLAETAALEAATEIRETHEVAVRALGADVTDLDAVREVARQAVSAFGPVTVLLNNAGRALLKPFTELTPEDWNAVLGVQLHGALNGIQAFLPGMVAHAAPSHIVNTSSMSGVGRADLRTLNAPYVTAKFAVIGLSETMAPALAEHGVGVSVLCPGFTHRNPESVTRFPMPSTRWYQHNLLTAEQVAEETVAGVLEGRLHIFPHRAGRQEVIDRHALLLRGFEQAEATSPPLRES